MVSAAYRYTGNRNMRKIFTAAPRHHIFLGLIETLREEMPLSDIVRWEFDRKLKEGCAMQAMLRFIPDNIPILKIVFNTRGQSVFLYKLINIKTAGDLRKWIGFRDLRFYMVKGVGEMTMKDTLTDIRDWVIKEIERNTKTVKDAR